MVRSVRNFWYLVLVLAFVVGSSVAFNAAVSAAEPSWGTVDIRAEWNPVTTPTWVGGKPIRVHFDVYILGDEPRFYETSKLSTFDYGQADVSMLCDFGGVQYGQTWVIDVNIYPQTVTGPNGEKFSVNRHQETLYLIFDEDPMDYTIDFGALNTSSN